MNETRPIVPGTFKSGNDVPDGLLKDRSGITAAARKVVHGAGFGLLLGIGSIVGIAVIFAPPFIWLHFAYSHFEFWWGIGVGISGVVLWAGIAGGVIGSFMPPPFSFLPPPVPLPPPEWRA
jgi:hypothetical protein